MAKIIIDFETYCDLDIKLVGAFKYTSHPSCRILCMSYKIDKTETEIWVPGQPWPSGLHPQYLSNDVFYAFGATFDYLVWNKVGCRDYPQYFTPLSSSKFIDIRALCARFRMPQNLKGAGIALGCSTQKMVTGTKLIRLCCTPAHTPTAANLRDLYTYCIIDTDVAAEILERLPADHFTPYEQRLWELTVRMNERGVPIDEVAVDSIIKYLAIYAESMKAVLPEVTKGFIQTAGQVQKIKQFCNMNGINLPNSQADTIEKFLKKDDLPEAVRSVLEVRQLVGLTSVKKYITIKHHVNEGYVQGNLNHHGAGTGRWAGQGFQYHNLPRAKRKDPEKWIQRFINKEPIEKPMEIAKALIRPMIKAPKNHMLVISDYSSIENRLLAWFCDDKKTLQLFKDKHCQYSDMAAFLYKKPVEEIDHEGIERFVGKTVILGCGYQMGKKRFQAVAADRGIELTLVQAEAIILAYRAKYSLVVKMWKAYDNAAKQAVRYPGKAYKTHKCIFKVVVDNTTRTWLRITLPSNRSMMYADPKVEDDKYGPVVKYIGLNAKTFQMTSTALTPGLITENIVQAAARDVLAHGKLQLEEHMPEVALSISVHDEAGGMIKKSDITDSTMDKFNSLMCTKQSWMTGLPLEAKGYIAERYRKD